MKKFDFLFKDMDYILKKEKQIVAVKKNKKCIKTFILTSKDGHPVLHLKMKRISMR